MKSDINNLYLALILSFFGVFIFLSCAQQMQWANQIDWKEYEFSNLPGEKEYPQTGALILLDEGTMEVTPAKQMFQTVFERHKIIKILSPQGFRFANIAVPYSADSFVDHLKARTISPTGKITVLENKNIYDITLYPNFVFFSDQRAKIFTLPAVENGAVIEFSYQIKYPVKTFGHAWSFQDDVPTLISRFTLLEPMDTDINYRLYGLNIEPKINKVPEGFKSTYVWEARDVAALNSEFAMPPINDCLAHLKIAPLGIKSWRDVAQWYYELAKPQKKAMEDIKQMTQKLIAGADNDVEKLRRIYEWVRDQIRYLAVSIGIGSFQPHPAEEILQNRYGDCKDMTTLLCAMAQEAGLAAYDALISTYFNGCADTSLPSPYHFNHAIAFCPSIGDSGLWLDATEKGCPFGQVPWYDQGMAALVVGKQGEPEIRFVPQAPPDSNETLLAWEVQLDSIGAATISGKSQWRGALASEMREDMIFTPPAQQRQWLETYLAKRCPAISLHSFDSQGLSPAHDPLTIFYLFDTPAFAQQRSQKLVFTPATFLLFDLADYFRSELRTFSIQWRFGMKLTLVVNLNLPPGMQAENLLAADSLKTMFGNAYWNSTFSHGKLTISMSKLIYGHKIEPENYPAFQKFLDMVQQKDGKEIVLIRN